MRRRFASCRAATGAKNVRPLWITDAAQQFRCAESSPPATSAVITKAELQRLRQFREKKHREELGLFVVEGEKVVGELMAAGYRFEEIYATLAWNGLNAARTGAARLWEISTDEMARASHFPTPSAVLAIGRIQRADLPPGALRQGLTLALDGVQDPGNVGTLLRIADWYALDRVLLSPDCADLFHQKVINASMGSFVRVSTYTARLATALADPGVPVIGCDLTGTDVHALPAVRDAVIVIGSEGRGLSAATKALLTERVTIPRFGRAESLNASIAAAIVCDNLRRARA